MIKLNALEMAARISVMQAQLELVSEGMIVKACQMVAQEARRVIGEGYDSWPELSAATLARKIWNQGPLLETGALKNSIGWTKISKLHGRVGATDPKARFHELGTSRIPPRSFILAAWNEKQKEVQRLAVRAVAAVVAGRGHSHELMEFLHAAKIAYEILHEAGHDLVSGEDEKGRRHR